MITVADVSYGSFSWVQYAGRSWYVRLDVIPEFPGVCSVELIARLAVIGGVRYDAVVWYSKLRERWYWELWRDDEKVLLCVKPLEGRGDAMVAAVSAFGAMEERNTVYTVFTRRK